MPPRTFGASASLQGLDLGRWRYGPDAERRIEAAPARDV
jgi:hypothetical protein